MTVSRMFRRVVKNEPMASVTGWIRRSCIRITLSLSLRYVLKSQAAQMTKLDCVWLDWARAGDRLNEAWAGLGWAGLQGPRLGLG